MFRRCDSIVLSLRNSAAAISRFVRRSVTRRAIASSRLLSAPIPLSPGEAGPRATPDRGSPPARRAARVRSVPAAPEKEGHEPENRDRGRHHRTAGARRADLGRDLAQGVLGRAQGQGLARDLPSVGRARAGGRGAGERDPHGGGALHAARRRPHRGEPRARLGDRAHAPLPCRDPQRRPHGREVHRRRARTRRPLRALSRAIPSRASARSTTARSKIRTPRRD